MTNLLIGHDSGISRITVNGSARVEQVLDTKPILGLEVDPLVRDRVYAVSPGDGLLISDDGGSTWKSGGDGIANPTTWSIAVSLADRVEGLGAVYVGTQPSALYRSTDGARSFTELSAFQEIANKQAWSFPPEPDTHHIHQIALSVEDPDALVAGVELGGVHRTDDGGATWYETAADPDPHTLVSNPGAPRRIYEGGGASFAESRDDGLTWERDIEGIPDEVRYFYGLTVDSGDRDTVLISAARDPFTGHGIFPDQEIWSTIYRRSGTDGWHEVTDGLPPAAGTAMGGLAADPGEGGTIYYATTVGLFRSSDGGEAWEEVLKFEAGQLPRHGHPPVIVTAGGRS